MQATAINTFDTNMFDTLALTKKLRESGVPELQAEAHAEAMADMFKLSVSTKQDIKDLFRALNDVETSLRGEIKDVETNLKNEIKNVRSEIKDVETSLRGEIKDVETNLRGEIKDVRSEMKLMETRLVIKLGAMLVLAVTVLGTLQKLL